MKHSTFWYRFNSVQVKQDLISSIINFVNEFSNNLRLMKAGNLRKILKLDGDRALPAVSIPEIKF